jgi:long-chain acyl-CoA synthetase
MRVASCAQFLQGYGLTETCAATFVVHPDEPVSGRGSSRVM